MKNLLVLSLLIAFSVTNINAQSSCEKAKEYEKKITDANENWTPDQRARNNCPQGWAQLGAWYAYKCECDKGVPTKNTAEQLVANMNLIRNTIKTQFPHCGEVPPVMTVDQIKIAGGTTDESTSDNKEVNSETDPVLQYTGYEGKYQRLKDEYIKTFSGGKTYNAYVRGENIKRTGIVLAKQLSGGLDQINTNIESSNPENILREFNRKIQQIEQMEASFNEQNNQYSFDAGVQIGNSISSKDWETGFHQLGGLINASVEAREAQRKLEAKRYALYQARRNKMSQIYWKAVDYNQAQRKKYLKAAAYAKNKDDEAYYLAFVDNLDCFLEKMEQNFSVTNTYWLNNSCPVPTLKETPKLNTGQSESDKLIEAAERKYKHFRRTEEDVFRKAAIAFVSSALKKEPKTEYFVKLADYYKGYSYILEYTALLSANAYAQNPSDGLKKRTERLKTRVKYEINSALDYNDIEYLKSFLDFNLDQIVFVDNKNVLDYAIEQDKPEAVLTILNHKNQNKSKNEITANINNVLMLSAINNSPKIIEILIKNGVEPDVTINGQTPLDAANRFLNAEAFEILMKASGLKAINKKKYKDAPVQILIQAQDNSIKAARLLDMKSNTEIAKIVEYVLNPSDSQPQYLSLIGNSAKAKLLIFKNKQLSQNLKAVFYSELQKSYPESKAYVILETGLLRFTTVPKLSELKVQKEQTDEISSERPLSHKEEVELLVEYKITRIGQLDSWKPDPRATQDLDAKYLKEYISSMEKTHNSMKKQLKKEIQWLEDIKNQNTAENRKAVLKELLLNRTVLSKQELWTQYGHYYAENYMRSEPYTFEEKIKLFIEFEEMKLKEDIDQAIAEGRSQAFIEVNKEMANSSVKRYRSFLKDKEKLSFSDKQYLSASLSNFPGELVKHDKPLDAEAVEAFFGVNVQGHSKNDINLAFYARKNDNRLVFGALDKQFDLSKVKNSDGESLLETIIIKEGCITTHYERKAGDKTRQLFYSKDFKFERKSPDGYDLVYLFLNYLVEQTDYPIVLDENNFISRIFNDFYEVYDFYDLDLNRKITPAGGTFLHWFVDMLIAYTPDEKMENIGNSPVITRKVTHIIDSWMVNDFKKFIASHGELNRKAVDNNGLTAYDYYKRNQDKIYPYMENKSNFEEEKTKKVMKRILR